jgi:hypothetical protein
LRYRTEDKLQAAVIKAIEAEWPAVWWLHPHGGMYQRPGIPDLLLCVGGAFIGIELKNPRPGESGLAARERTTPIQRKEIRAINRAGGTARTAISVEEAVAVVRTAVQARQEITKETSDS